MKLSLRKCCPFLKEVRYFDQAVREHGVASDPQKTRAIKDWPIPTSVGKLRIFLGLYSYYPRFIKQFATIAAPLHGLIWKGQKFESTQECREVFQQLKDTLKSAMLLMSLEPSVSYILETDWKECCH